MIKRTFVANARKILLRRGRSLLRRSAGVEAGDLLGGLAAREQDELAEIHRALERIERGIYGRCTACSSAMSEPVMEETPWRSECEACAEAPQPTDEPRTHV